MAWPYTERAGNTILNVDTPELLSRHRPPFENTTPRSSTFEYLTITTPTLHRRLLSNYIPLFSPPFIHRKADSSRSSQFPFHDQVLHHGHSHGRIAAISRRTTTSTTSPSRVVAKMAVSRNRRGGSRSLNPSKVKSHHRPACLDERPR